MSLFQTLLEEVDEEAEPRVLSMDEEGATTILQALSSETARKILNCLQNQPRTPATIAEEIDSSLQNIHYHLNRMNNAGAIEVVGTVYSEKGRKMKLYAPSADPLVFVSGDGHAAEISELLSK